MLRGRGMSRFYWEVSWEGLYGGGEIPSMMKQGQNFKKLSKTNNGTPSTSHSNSPQQFIQKQTINLLSF